MECEITSREVRSADGTRSGSRKPKLRRFAPGRHLSKLTPKSLKSLDSLGSTMLSSPEHEKILLSILRLNCDCNVGLRRSRHGYQSQWKFLYRSLYGRHQR